MTLIPTMVYYSRYTTERKDIVLGVSLLWLITPETLDGVLKTVGLYSC
jgi:hypothetical protein